MMRLLIVEKDSKQISMQKVVTLNTCCDIACLTFHLPHITAGSFQSQQQLKNASNLLSDEKVLHFT